jgi:spermidine synthase
VGDDTVQVESDYLARAHSERGELMLRRRPHDGAIELRVNGVFVMDTAETTSERLLATSALAACRTQPSDGLSVLVGGLGLGFTLSELLTDVRVARVVVAEIEPEVLRWHRRGLVGVNRPALVDPRVQIRIADVRQVLASTTDHSLDLVLLDVDNGPDFLVYDGNSDIYRSCFLRTCRQVLAPGGLTAIWSASRSEPLAERMAQVFDAVECHCIRVRPGKRDEEYFLYLGRG